MTATIIKLADHFPTDDEEDSSYGRTRKAVGEALETGADLATVENAMELVFIELQRFATGKMYDCAQNASCYAWMLDVLANLRTKRHSLQKRSKVVATVYRFADFARVAGRAVKREGNRRCGVCRRHGHNRATCSEVRS